MGVIARIYPDGLDSDNGNWTLTGAATKPEAIDDLWGNHDGDVSYIQCDDNSQEIRFTMGSMPAATVINFIELVPIAIRVGGLSFAHLIYGIRSGGVDSGTTTQGLGSSYDTPYRTRYEVDPATGSPWTTAGVNAILTRFLSQTQVGFADLTRLTSAYIEVDGVLDPVHLGAARDVASRQLWLRRSLLPTIRGRLPFAAVDRQLLELAQWTHYAGPRPTAEGWGMKKWEREIGMNLSQEIDLDSPDLAVLVEDLNCRRFFLLDWDPGISEEPPGANSPGIPRLNAGAGRTFDRASKAWIENGAAAAQGLVQVSEIPEDVEKNTTLGLLIEGAMTNEQVRSSFVNGETGWTSAGEGSNGSAIALDTGTLLFDPDITPNSLKFTAGNPIHVADLQVTGVATAAIADNAMVVVSFDHKDNSASAPLYYQAIRDVGGVLSYWRDSDATWQAGATWNAMTGSTAWHRHITKVINVGTNTPDCTLTVRVGIPTATGVAGQVNYLAHVQIEKNRWASSRIVTAAAVVSRALDDLRLENHSDARVWPEQQGTTVIWFRPNWNSADIAGGANPDLLRPTNDASNFERLFYSQSTGQFRFRRRVGGTNYTADFTTALTRGTLYKIGIRRTGTEAELGVAAYTLDIFVNGVKGASAVAVANPAWDAASTLFIGQDEVNAQHAEGYLTQRLSTPVVLTDEELIAETS